MKQLSRLALAVLLLCSATVRAQVPEGSKKLVSRKEFFLSEEPVRLSLTGDFKKLKSQKKKGAYVPATATLHVSPTDSATAEISVAARGEFRRQQCQMPSLMVDFKGNNQTALSNLKKLKMVCGCSVSSYDERLLLMEYLAYKIYEVITDMSFRTRLARVTYTEAANKAKTYEQYAFFIEDVDDMAKRNGCKEYGKVARSTFLARNQLTLMTIFQYMIGNTDWSIPNYHNIKLIQKADDSLSLPFAVPYDFDFSGLVNAPYAYPNQELFAIEKVTDRVYRGVSCSQEEIDTAVAVFQSNKEKILALVANFELLPQKDRRSMGAYLEDFYQTISNKQRVRYEFIENVRKN